MDNINQYVVFQIDKEEYLVPILKVNEIIRLKGINITQVPNTYKYIVGIINLRGEVIPIMDLRLRFSIARKALNDNNRIIIVNLQDKLIGLLVDSVSEVIEVDSSKINEPPEEISDIDNKYIQGVARYKDRIIVLLDIDLVMKDNLN